MALRPAAAEPGPSSSGWGVFVGGVVLGSTVAAGAAYLAVRLANSAAAADDARRAAANGRRRPGRCVPVVVRAHWALHASHVPERWPFFQPTQAAAVLILHLPPSPPLAAAPQGVVGSWHPWRRALGAPPGPCQH